VFGKGCPMPKDKNLKRNDTKPWHEEDNEDWYEKYETKLKERESSWNEHLSSWQSEQASWDEENQGEWDAEEARGRVVEERVTTNLLRTLKIGGGLVVGAALLVGIVKGSQGNFSDVSSTSEVEIVEQQPELSLPIVPSITPQQQGVVSLVHPSSPEAQCGDPNPSPSDYPLLMYPVLVQYSPQDLSIITSHYCADAKKIEGDIMVASFQSIDNATSFASKMKDAVGNSKIDKPVWIDSASKVASFPKKVCGDPKPPSNQSTAQFYRVYVGNQEGFLKRIQSLFCQDAYEAISTPDGQSLIKVATFIDKGRASRFKEFITRHLEIEVDRNISEQSKPENNINVQHKLLLQQCGKQSSGKLNKRYTVRWFWGNDSFEGVLSLKGNKGIMTVELSDTEGQNPSIQQTITLQDCSFGGTALIGNDPVDIKTQKPSNYIPDHFFVKVLSNGLREVTVCSEGWCVPAESFTSP
jgi:hypothetical protein